MNEDFVQQVQHRGLARSGNQGKHEPARVVDL